MMYTYIFVWLTTYKIWILTYLPFVSSPNLHIDAYKPPLLIKPPVQQYLNKPPLFLTKSPLFEAFLGLFEAFMGKFSINLHLETLIF